jgi:molecular chaperone DnaK
MRTDIDNARNELSAEMENEGATAESLKSKTETLTEKAMKLGEIVYKAKQEEEGAAPAPDAGQESDDAKTTDADFEEKK